MSRKIPASRAKTEEKQDEEGNDVRSSDLAVRGRPDDVKEAFAATPSVRLRRPKRQRTRNDRCLSGPMQTLEIGPA